MPQILTKAAFLAIAAAAMVSAAPSAGEPHLALRYHEPAAKWTEALPVGNGRIGAMVFGGIEEERLQINEATLWGGGPHDYTNPESHAHLAEIRQLIFEGKVREAEELSASLMGDPKVITPYQPFCDLRLHFGGQAQATTYSRELDLDEAAETTSYRIGDVRFERQVFVSYPDQMLVIRLTASEPGQLTFGVSLDSPQPGTQLESTSTNKLRLTGQIQPRQNPARTWTASWDQPGLKFAAVLQVVADGGSVRAGGKGLEVSAANAVTILFSNATSFRDYRDMGGDALATAEGYVQQASARPFSELRRRHEEDFHSLFDRVRLRLGDENTSETTDRRIADFVKAEDPSLLALYFEFGRYLLISSSRPGGQPANLQGIWNEDLLPAWGSKWTTNINLQMNYWEADAGDLWETEQPLWALIRDLRVTGAETARVEYGSKGWVLHHSTDLWRATSPVDGPWGIWPTGAVWLANQMWDHYLFSNDRAFLETQAYPAMKEAAEFALTSMVEAPPGTPVAGRLVTNPSASPENQYVLEGKGHYLTYAPTMDVEMIRQLFEDCERAARLLGKDAEFAARLEAAQKRLPALKIGGRGQLQEWVEDYEEVEPAHRHVSHLWALFPGHDISLQATPELAAAAKKSLELRGDGGTGWSTVWRVALWARLHNPEHAYNNLKILMTRSTLPDMLDLHPPFQIDGNLGGPAVISEMLVQSNESEIDVLPALPKQWPEGSLTGVRLRGGATLDVAWKDGRLTECKLRCDRAMKYRVMYGDRSVLVELKSNKPVVLDQDLQESPR
jgi:alpha-L-fucosidase 2